MIIDQSSILHGISISRMSEYLSLCKIECLVRKVDYSTPSRRVDQPGKAGQAGTITEPIHSAKHFYNVKIDYNLKLGNKSRTLSIKRELVKRLGPVIEHLGEAGTVILQQDGKDTMKLPLYEVIQVADNFANKRKEWKFCLATNKQEKWVKTFQKLSEMCRHDYDYLIVINNGRIGRYSTPQSKGGN